VVDDAHIVSPRDQEYLDLLIRRIYEASKVQMQVLTIDSLNGEPIEQASIQVTDKWKLGNKGDDKGALLMVAVADRKVRIEVGQGLEGDLPDILASRIIREVILPRFKQGDMSGGVVAGVQAVATQVAPDLGLHVRKKRPMTGDASVAVIYLIFILLTFVFSLFGRRRGFWGGGGYWGGGFGGGGFGGGGFSGGGGGGWSGGGGGFSGGGASGGW
jgi:uncharacterized protein